MPNNDYILRGDAVSAFCGNCEATEICGQLGEPCEEVKRINAIPAADVEPVKHGYWVYKMRESTKYENVTGFDELGFIHTVTVQTHVKGPVPYCGLCDALAADSFMDHCPRCGAKMDAEPPKEEDA